MSVNNSIANNIQAQKEKLYIPNIPEIINMYELYFSKYPTQFIKFYNFLKNQLTKVLNFPTITLEGNFITAKSLINDKSEIINLTDDINKSNSTCQPLQDLNIVQEKPKQRLEELISKLTADKYNLHNTHTGSLGRTGLTQEVLVRERWTKLQSNYGMAGSRFRFLDDSWTIRDRFLDDLNNIIFFMALEQFWGETSWYVGSLNGFLDRKRRRDEISKTSETY
ncbi:hypothetical protein RhiirB3_464864 [Rhizophagus irregularis]|nr:hypothetical protein RhiirB3_464864 [Rhizophagus irregularis]